MLSFVAIDQTIRRPSWRSPICKKLAIGPHVLGLRGLYPNNVSFSLHDTVLDFKPLSRSFPSLICRSKILPPRTILWKLINSSQKQYARLHPNTIGNLRYPACYKQHIRTYRLYTPKTWSPTTKLSAINIIHKTCGSRRLVRFCRKLFRLCRQQLSRTNFTYAAYCWWGIVSLKKNSGNAKFERRRRDDRSVGPSSLSPSTLWEGSGEGLCPLHLLQKKIRFCILNRRILVQTERF